MAPLFISLLLYLGPWDDFSSVPSAPETWKDYYTCDFISPDTGLRIVIYYQGMPCGPTAEWVGYRQQFNGAWQKNTSVDWGNLDLSFFSCCNPT